MDEKEKEQILKLYPEFKNIYGPYKRKNDGRKVVILYDGNKRSARQYAKVRLECKLNRRLINEEEVNHKDRDKTNDDYDNLEVVVDKSTHSKKDVLYRKEIKLPCVYCGIILVLSEDQINSRSKKKAGPFCSKTCSGKYGSEVQKTGKIIPRTKFDIEYEYRY